MADDYVGLIRQIEGVSVAAIGFSLMQRARDALEADYFLYLVFGRSFLPAPHRPAQAK